MDYNKLSQEIYEWNKSVGWWDDPDRCLYTTLQLVSTEIAEATEGERKDLMDDHIPHRKMGEVELADALIRVLDFGAHVGLEFDWKVDGHGWIREDSSIGKQHLAINLVLMQLVEAYAHYHAGNCTHGDVPDRDMMEMWYSCLIQSIADVAEKNGYDLAGATADKMAFNKTRLDHKREYRHGDHFDSKKF